MIENFVIDMIKSGYNNTSKSKSWNVLETVLSHLKCWYETPQKDEKGKNRKHLSQGFKFLPFGGGKVLHVKSLTL